MLLTLEQAAVLDPGKVPQPSAWLELARLQAELDDDAVAHGFPDRVYSLPGQGGR